MTFYHGQLANSDGIVCVVCVEERQWSGWKEDQEVQGECKGEFEFNQGLVKAWTKDKDDDPYTLLLVKILLNVMKGHAWDRLDAC